MLDARVGGGGKKESIEDGDEENESLGLGDVGLVSE